MIKLTPLRLMLFLASMLVFAYFDSQYFIGWSDYMRPAVPIRFGLAVLLSMAVVYLVERRP